MLIGNEYFYSYTVLGLVVVQGIAVGACITKVIMNGHEQRLKKLEKWRSQVETSKPKKKGKGTGG
jgi:hypothetical protein